MEIVSSQAKLLDAVSFISTVVVKNSVVPVLNNIKISCQDGALRLETSNGDITSIVTVSDDKLKSFTEMTTVPAYQFLDVIKHLRSGTDINLKLQRSGDSESIIIKNANTKITLSCLSAEHFPISQDFTEFDHSFSISSKDLINLIDKTKFSIYQNDNKYNLAGLLLHTKKEGDVNYLYAVSTDGHRLSLAKCAVDSGVELPKVLVPRKAVSEIRKLLDRKSDVIEVCITKNKIKFKAGNYINITRLMDAEFPDYEKVIPHQNANIFECKTKDFMEAITRVTAVYFSNKETALSIVIDPAATMFEAKTSINAAHDSIESTFSGPEQLKTSYNYVYLVDALSHVDTDRVRIFFSDGNKACVVRPMDSQDYFFVVMPIRI